jgi:hypothetical protein
MTTLALLAPVISWWDQLSLAQHLFYGIGIMAGVVALILTVLAVIGLEHHDAVDALGSASVDHGGGGIFSVKPLTGFFLGFGWAGGLALDGGFSLTVALLAGLVSGGGLMALIVAMFRAIYAMRSDGTMRIEDALNANGTVYVSLPASRVAGGQVLVSFSGRQETLNALNATDQVIASGQRVKVIQVIDTRTVLVEPI